MNFDPKYCYSVAKTKNFLIDFFFNQHLFSRFKSLYIESISIPRVYVL